MSDPVGASSPRMSNFITEIIDADLASGRHTQVVTRFPPEPNGYLHIGHAKSICLNFGLAAQYGGRCHLRFDDTNPLTEDVEYVRSIQEDIQWLGFDWGEHLYFASDYFERFYELAMRLVLKGLAYVDEQSVETIREQRGTVTEPGVESPFRERSVEENVQAFEAMRRGDYPEGGAVLRARIDMASSNMIMRDPLLYRVRHAHHHRTGDAWCIYPMYDYAHCLEDAFEGVTHSVCTLEFDNNRELYDWVIVHTEVPWTPRQYEFARFNLDFTITSKRKLLQLVNEGHVDGWDDPRMPTISGMRRRGVTPAAIRALTDMFGVSKSNGSIDMGKFEFCIRDDLNPIAPRVMCVLHPLKVVITNWPDGHVEELDAPYFPEGLDRAGSRTLPFSGDLWVERDDFAEQPAKGWYRLAPGASVRLRHGYVITCDEVVRDASGEVVELRCSYDPQTKSHQSETASQHARRVRGVIHWVSAAHAHDVEVRLYDRLFRVARPGSDPDVDFIDELNPASCVVVSGAKIEPSVAGDDVGTRYQFERVGFFMADAKTSVSDRRVFNRIVSLKDSWAKSVSRESSTPATVGAKSTTDTPAQSSRSDDTRSHRRTKSQERERLRATEPRLAELYARISGEFTIDESDADLLTGDVSLGELAYATLTDGTRLGIDAGDLVKWLTNDVLRLADDDGRPPEKITSRHLIDLVRSVEDQLVTVQAAREILDHVVATGAPVADLINELGLERDDDISSLRDTVARVLAAHPEEVERYRGGKTGLLGFFTGAVMREVGASADASVVRQLLQELLA